MKGGLELTVGFTVDILIVFFILNIMDKQELTVILPLFYFEKLIFSSFEQS